MTNVRREITVRANKKRHLAVVQDPWNLMFQVGAPGDGTDAAAFRLPSKNEGQRNTLPNPRASQRPRCERSTVSDVDLERRLERVRDLRERAVHLVVRQGAVRGPERERIGERPAVLADVLGRKDVEELDVH